MRQIAELDAVDWAILEAMQKNARLPNKALAAQAGIAESTCYQRIRGLIERGVISGFHADVELAALGRHVHALIAIRFRPHTRELVEPFWRYVMGLPETLMLSHISGADDFLLQIAVPDIEHLRDFILDRLTSRPEIEHVETTILYEQRRKQAIEPLL
jgi:DNA-binding Lrp family transcriptional regulator